MLKDAKLWNTKELLLIDIVLVVVKLEFSNLCQFDFNKEFDNNKEGGDILYLHYTILQKFFNNVIFF